MLAVAVVAVAVAAVAAAVHQRQPISVVLSEEVALSVSLVRELAVGVHLRLVRVPVPQHDHAPYRRGVKSLPQIHGANTTRVRTPERAPTALGRPQKTYAAGCQE